MNNYKQIAFRYLKRNTRRSIVTIIGVTVAVTVLYAMLNLLWCWVLMKRDQIREEKDYEIVFYTETEEQAASIMADDQVKSASIGKYYNDNYYEPVLYENALYINTTNPYRMLKTFRKMENTYGVEGEINKDLAITYLQAGDGNLFFVIFVFCLLVSFIFAIFGIGIIRNSIQLSILEQIKDYGNMRCIGSTKSQLKSVVYIQGAVLELTGNAIGVVLGYIVCLLLGRIVDLKVGFHLLPVLPILIAFFGDLYFAMEENCKVIVNLTPVSAIRGEYRIHKEKFKARKKSIFAKLFGVEGDYAYKSIMRSPARFHKTVWALGIGMAAFMALMSVTATINGYVKETKELFGYYPVYFEKMIDIDSLISEVQSDLPPVSALEKLTKMDGVTDAKRIYSSMVLLGDFETYFSHYREEYLTETEIGTAIAHIHTSILENHDAEDGKEDFWKSAYVFSTEVACYGYDDVDMERYRKVLVEGTLDVSEHGLILINGGTVTKTDTGDAMMPGSMEVEYTDYKVGDTIDIVDMGKYRTRITEEFEVLKAEYEEELEKLSEHTEENHLLDTTPQEELEQAYYYSRQKKIIQCRDELIEEGSFKTYTIEGIVSRDVNHYGAYTGQELAFILPLDEYYAFTGTDETMVTGMQYHFDRFSAKDFFNTVYYGKGGIADSLDFGDWEEAGYPELMEALDSMKNSIRWGMLIVIFIVSMSTFNIINTTAGNLYLRRKEFAQMRVIGISQKRLMKMVMLEGVIADIVANIIGIVLGTSLSMISAGMMAKYIFGTHMYFPFWEALVGFVVSTLVTCGSIYVPLKGLKQDMAADLATGGD